MLQFYNKILSKKGFVDLHNHTNDSYGEEMDKMNLSPEELLESVYEYTQLNSCPATFALTDHNSIEGDQKIDLLIKSNPKKYENINFIPGAEFTCSAGSLGTITNNLGHVKNIFKNFHMLAYGFNPYDEDLAFLCKLHSTRRQNTITLTTNNGVIKISAGAYVLAIKNILKDYGINLTLNEFKDVNLNTDGIDEHHYINYLIKYIEKFSLPEMIKKDIFYQLSNRNMITLGRLDCMEVMEIVQNAGGYCVLAHPCLLKLGSWSKEDPAKTEETFKTKLSNVGINFGENSSIRTLAFQYCAYILKNEARNPVTGKRLTGIVGIETLHSTVREPLLLKKLVQTARDNSLYITGGSDSHGNLIQAEYLGKFLPIDSLSKPNVNTLYMTNNLFAENLLSGKIKENVNCNKNFDQQIEITKVIDGLETKFSYNDLYNFLNNSNRKFTTKNKPAVNKQTNMEQTRIITSGTISCGTITFLYSKVLRNKNITTNQVLQEYKNISAFLPAVNLAVTTISNNYFALKDKKYVQKFLREYANFKELRRRFNEKYPEAVSRFKDEEKNNDNENTK